MRPKPAEITPAVASAATHRQLFQELNGALLAQAQHIGAAFLLELPENAVILAVIAVSEISGAFSHCSRQVLRSQTRPAVMRAAAGLSSSRCRLRCSRTARLGAPALPAP